MHIDVSNILASDEGARTSFKIAGEQPHLPDVALTEPVEGEIHFTRVDFGLASSGQARTSLQLECHRCLSSFSYAVALDLAGQFTANPQPEQWSIEAGSRVDLGPLVRQELVLNTPIKQLCQPDCLGLCVICGRKQTNLHIHPDEQIQHAPRITKGKSN